MAYRRLDFCNAGSIRPRDFTGGRRAADAVVEWLAAQKAGGPRPAEGR